MERLYRAVFFVLFVLGFIGAIASADRTGDDGVAESSMVSMIRDVRLANEINDLNRDRWNQDVTNGSEDGLSKVESMLNHQDDLSNRTALNATTGNKAVSGSNGAVQPHETLTPFHAEGQGDQKK